MEHEEALAALEAILFAAGDPVGVERLCLALEMSRPAVEQLCKELSDHYRFERRGLRLLQMEHSYQLSSAPECAPYVRKATETRKPARLSQPALEVLAVIAYYGPTTKAYVDQIRGVDSSYTVGLLAERELIEECGRLAVPGRPILYRTTKTFLRSFGLTSLEELPELPELSAEEEQRGADLRGEIARLQGEAALAEAGAVTDEELEAAARELARRESGAAEGESQ